MNPFSSTSTRRRFVQHALGAAGAALAWPTAFFIHAPRRTEGPIIGHGDFRYRVDKAWGAQDPAQVPVQHCHEMVEDRQGRLFMTTTDTHNNIVIYDKSGRVLGTWGHDYPGAHGLTHTEEGEDEFLFITDTDRHFVVKTTLDGHEVMRINYPQETGRYTKASQFKPTEVAVAPNGDFYIADGYGENFIIQYNHKGEYIRHFGGKGNRHDQTECCHGVAIDLRTPNDPVLLVTARTRNELRRYTLEGSFLNTIPLKGHYICRPVLSGTNLFFAVIVTKSWGQYDGHLIVMDENFKAVSAPGGSAPEYLEDGTLKPTEYDGTFLNPHDVCADRDGNLYVPQWYSGRTYPVRLERV